MKVIGMRPSQEKGVSELGCVKLETGLAEWLWSSSVEAGADEDAVNNVLWRNDTEKLNGGQLFENIVWGEGEM